MWLRQQMAPISRVLDYKARMMFAIILAFQILLIDKRAEVCNNAACKKLASVIHQSLDPSVNPCDNFFRFACGKFLRYSTIGDDQMVASRVQDINNKISNLLFVELVSDSRENHPPVLQKAKDFFISCLNTDIIEQKGVDELKDMLNQFGGWPVLDDRWDEETFDWVSVTKKLAEVGQNQNLLLTVEVGPNDKNSAQKVILIDEPLMGEEVSLERSVLLSGPEDPVVNTYYKVMVDSAVELGADHWEAHDHMKDVLRFEISLAKIITPTKDLRDIQSVIETMTVAQLERKYPFQNWLLFLNSVMGGAVKIRDDDVVELRCSGYVQRLWNLLAVTKKRVLADFMLWQVVLASQPYLTSRVLEIQQELQNVRYGMSYPPPRETFCFEKTFELLKPILAAAYVRKYFDPITMNNATKFIKLLQKQLLKIIEEVDWLDPVTRERALRKVEGIKSFVGFPDELIDDVYLDKYYEQLKMNSSDFYGNYLRINSFNRGKAVGKLHQVIDLSAWEYQGVDGVLEWEATYDTASNAIKVQSGVLQGVSYSADRPQYLNLATLGPVIGHELIHSVDDQGAEIDENGNLNNWWNDEAKLIFLAKAKAVGDEYSSFVAGNTNITLNGHNMQGEAIADEGGVKIAFMALEEVLSQSQDEPRLEGFEHYSARQLFWIAEAAVVCTKVRPEVLKLIAEGGTHPTPELRINGPFRNSIKFSEVWGCPVGSYMNPERKVNVW